MNLKSFVLKIHTYLGLATALVLIVIAISGCFYSFQDEIRSVFYADILTVSAPDDPKSIPMDRIMDISREAYPASGIREIVVNSDPNKTIKVYTHDLHLLYHNPYNGEVVSIQNRQKDPFLLAWQLHTHLGLGKVGRQIVGAATLLTIPLFITGLILWWPKKKKTAYNLPTKGSWKKMNHQWHNNGGFYAFIILLFLSLTGLMMSYQWFEDSVYFLSASPAKDRELPLSPISELEGTPLQEAVAYAKQAYTDVEEYSISFPKSNEGIYLFRLRFKDQLNRIHLMYFNQYNGELLSFKPYEEYTRGDKIKAMNFQIHSGKIAGLPGRIIAFLVTLFLAFLCISGFMMWLIKRNKKVKRALVILPFMIAFSSQVVAQEHSFDDDKPGNAIGLDAVVISASRSEQKLSDVPIPIAIITKDDIAKSGAVQLDQLLAEQTGIQLNSNHGTGPMIQGMLSDYIMIMIDGEPLVGRTSGTLELKRIGTSNIERIEIIKGPSSSLYGSEAMGGIINIITRKNTGQHWNGGGSLQIRSFNTVDLNAHAGKNWDSGSFTVYGNRLSTKGYSLVPDATSNTIPPYQNHSLAAKTSIQILPKLTAGLSLRYFKQDQQDVRETKKSNVLYLIDTKRLNQDFSISPSLHYSFNNKHKLQLKTYYTGYQYDEDMKYQEDGSPYEQNFSNQTFSKTELVYNAGWHKNFQSTAGVGLANESIKATRFIGTNRFNASYAFLQQQWRPNEHLNLIAGMRYDHHSDYEGQLSPKLATRITLTPWLSIDGSIGGGYKAPEFRQLLLVHHNVTSGYTVLGTNIVVEEMTKMVENGEVKTILMDPNDVKPIQAESSISYNAGLNIKAHQKLNFQVSAFQNNIHNLIETMRIGIKTNGKNLSTYSNITEARTKGFELEGHWQSTKNIKVSGGYMLLSAQDLDVVKEIEKGNMVRKGAKGEEDSIVKLNEYGGLFNRSKHSGNLKMFYHNFQYNFDLSLRAIYTGRAGFKDLNKNKILDIQEEYNDGYFNVNLGLIKEVSKQLHVETGIQNLFDHTQANIPHQPGRTYYIGLNFRI